MIDIQDWYIRSINRKNRIRIRVWKKEGIEYRGILQISHGMQEHIERYDEVARYFAAKGYIVAGNDHLGHGESIQDMDELGFFQGRRPHLVLIQDLHNVTKKLCGEFPELPVFLLGHSMGSFIARGYIAHYGKELAGVILVGTGNRNRVELLLGGIITFLEGMLRGGKHRSMLLYKLMFGSYNIRFSKDVDGKQWLTKDKEIVDKYIVDDKCMFLFTVQGVSMLIRLLQYIESPWMVRRIPKELPVYFVSGKCDPVGHFGKDVRKLFHLYKKEGIQKVSFRLYPEDRHEVLNETDRAVVYKGIKRWMEDYNG